MRRESQMIFDCNAVEFVTVTAEFCKFLGQAEVIKRSTLVDTSLKTLPLFCLRVSMLPRCEMIGNETLGTFVTEETYEMLHMNPADLLVEKDDYLDVFISDMRYSNQPITRNISRDLTDIYRDIRGFIFVLQLGLSEMTNNSPTVCWENFALYRGQRSVNTLRALRDAKYNRPKDGEEDQDEEDE